MKREKKKKPSDYPQFAFRVSEEDKQIIAKHVEEAHHLLNKNLSGDSFRVKKNEILVSALILGLIQIKKKKRLVSK